MNNNKLSLAAIIKRADETDKPLHEVMLNANAEELETAPIALMAKMQEMLMVMDESIKFGLTGVRSRSGLTGGAAKSFGEALNHKGFKHLLGPVAEDALTYALAVGEANACMGRIVAAPTAGASGVLPGVMFALKKHYSLTNIDMQKGLVVAGNVGMVIASRASLSGAMGGCQAECGSAAAMAAAAAVYMLGGTNQAVDTAIAIVIKNMLGLVCDPVAGLVEVPCVKRNGGAAMQAILAAEMALAGLTSFIPADEAIDAMAEVGASMPCALRETAGGGLAHTPTALAWALQYFNSVK